MADPFKIPGIGMQPVEVSPKDMRVARPMTPGPEVRSFKDTLTDAVTEVQQLQTEADSTIKKLIAGEIKDVTEAMVAVEKASVSFQTMMAVRNRVVSAYEEIMRMQV